MNEIKIAAEIITSAYPGTCLTGAGISVDSGIPPFRGENSLWERYDPEVYVSIEGFSRNPVKVWELYRDLGEILLTAEPNAGHVALAELEKEKFINGIITQNIDGLHARAGSKKIVEYHGSSDRAICLDCNKTYMLDKDILKQDPPRCECGMVLKPDIVFYGEMIPQYAVLESAAMIADAGFILVVGTSGVTYPANQLPLQMKKRGGKVIEVNVEPTPLTPLADVSVFGSASDNLPAILDAIKEIKD